MNVIFYVILFLSDEWQLPARRGSSAWLTRMSGEGCTVQMSLHARYKCVVKLYPKVIGVATLVLPVSHKPCLIAGKITSV